MLDEVRTRLEVAFPESQVSLQGDSSRLLIVVVGPEFEGVSRVKRQQTVYACITDLIREGALHAVTIRANTPGEVDAGAAPDDQAKPPPVE